jgi:hypothetical protein
VFGPNRPAANRRQTITTAQGSQRTNKGESWHYIALTHMKVMTITDQALRRVAQGSILLVLWLVTQTATAVPTVDMTVTPLTGGVYQYQFSISNSGPDDLAILTITDAPLADALIPLTLVAPAGFLAKYDPGVGLTFGLVDFLEDTSPFLAGTTTSGFGFQSASSPAANFKTFEALSVAGEFFGGEINRATSTVPDGGGTGLLAGVALLAVAMARSRLLSLKA